MSICNDLTGLKWLRKWFKSRGRQAYLGLASWTERASTAIERSPIVLEKLHDANLLQEHRHHPSPQEMQPLPEKCNRRVKIPHESNSTNSTGSVARGVTNETGII
jgi:hypothetical protein